LSKGLSFSSHRGVIANFGRYFVKTGIFPKEFHSWLQEAFGKRQVNDYETFPALNAKDAVDLQKKADRFLKQTVKFLKAQGLL